MATSATRRKKAVTEATAEEPATTDDTKTDDTKADDTNTKTVTIDTKSGHVGITCENHELEPLGVLLTKCDTIDLAFKAGLREGDVVTSVNGVPVTDHEALIASINRATFSPNGELKLEYQTAATVGRPRRHSDHRDLRVRTCPADARAAPRTE